MTKYDKELDTRTDDYEDAVKPLNDAVEDDDEHDPPADTGMTKDPAGRTNEGA